LNLAEFEQFERPCRITATTPRFQTLLNPKEKRIGR
jgi:hypothetical protein